MKSMEAKVETIDRLAELTRNAGMDKKTALNVSVMMDEEADMQMLIRWIEVNGPTPDEILKKAREILHSGAA